MSDSVKRAEAANKAAYEAGLAEQARLLRLPAEQVGYLELDRMDSASYKRRLSEPAFVDRVNDLESKRPPRPVKS